MTQPAVLSLGVMAGAATVLAAVAVGAEGSTPTGATRVVSVESGTVRATVSGRGELASAQDVPLAFQTSGRIAHIYVEPGDHVHKGQLLARLDETAARAALASAEAAGSSSSSGGGGSSFSGGGSAPTAAATPAPTPAPVRTPAPTRTPEPTPTATPTSTPTATPTPADLDYVVPTPTPTPTPTPRPRPTPRPTPTPAATFPTTSRPSTTTKGTAPSTGTARTGGGARNAASLDSARAALRATRLRAPVTGTVAEVTGRVGDATGDGAFTTIIDKHRYTVDVSVSEDHIAKIHKGQRATVALDAVAGLRLKGHVTSVGLVPDSQTGSSDVTYPVTVTIDDPTRRARAGMTASVQIVTARASGLTIPAQALRGAFVTVAKGSKRTTTPVTVGVEGDERDVIASGLTAGEQVVETSASAQAGARAAANPSSVTTTLPSFGTRRFGGGTFFRPPGAP